jgi:23S rRNA pseudouridine1911/1915/1917 synthase
MLPKGQRRRTVKHDYRIARDAARAAGLEEGINPEHVIAPEPEIPVAERVIPQLDEEELEAEDGVRSFAADAAANGMRLDAYLAKAIPDISRSRIQLLADNGQISVNGQKAKSSLKLKGGDQISIEGEPRPEPLRAFAEDIPLTVVYEDKDVAVIDKPAGMMVHAGAGATDDARNRGTLVNALLGHFGKLSGVGGEERPGIVHRLDKMTSGLIVVAKNDVMHRKLAQLFVDRKLDKTYLALVQGWLKKDAVTLELPIARDLVHRTRMTTLRADGRSAVSHIKVVERIEGRFGKFTLVEVKIETGRTHQIRVHLQALGHPVVGDTLYGAAGSLRDGEERVPLERNFLHAWKLHFSHPSTRKKLELTAELPDKLTQILNMVKEPVKSPR